MDRPAVSRVADLSETLKAAEIWMPSLAPANDHVPCPRCGKGSRDEALAVSIRASTLKIINDWLLERGAA
jgi:hypothetical protein